jgi:hypothetical protein
MSLGLFEGLIQEEEVDVKKKAEAERKADAERKSEEAKKEAEEKSKQAKIFFTEQADRLLAVCAELEREDLADEIRNVADEIKTKYAVSMMHITKLEQLQKEVADEVTELGEDLSAIIEPLKKATINNPLATTNGTSLKKEEEKEKLPVDKTRFFCYAGKKIIFEDRNLSLKQIQDQLVKLHGLPEIKKATLEYDDKTGIIIPLLTAKRNGGGK